MAEYRLFFATDIHGSDLCWKKFVNAAKYLRCDVLVMGGDMTGKMLVPIIDRGSAGFWTRFGGTERTVPRDEVERLTRLIGDAGYYPYETTPDEVAALEADPTAVERLFRAKMTETLERWLAIADERLAGTDVVCLLGPANDDPFFVDDVLAGAGRVRNPDGTVVELPLGWSLISVGWSNPTPWDSPREEPEDALEARIEAEAAKLPGMGKAIFNLHVPPKDSRLDTAALLNADLSPVMRGGMPVLAGVGSTAVRASIERHQPALSLHGHIHESRGEAKLGRTIALNPGSEYSDGVLRAVVVTLNDKGVKGYQFMSG